MYENEPRSAESEIKSGRLIVFAVIISLLLNAALIFGLGSYYGFIPTGTAIESGKRTPTDTAKAYKSTVEQENAVVDVVKKVAPAVVSIVVTKDLPRIEQYSPFGDDPMLRQFFGPMYRQNGTEQQEIGGGSAFIISSDGLILTNRHVVEDTEADYTVLLNDERKLKAEVVARDQINDIALLRVKATKLPTVSLGNSDSIVIGQTVVAIGNALGEYRNTVSTGVVSGLARSIQAGDGMGSSETLRGVVQTDAAINPGNSGGPLLNLKGEVIGMNTAIVQGAQNIGFAIPINDAKKDIASVKKFNRIVRPMLGIRYVTNNKAIAARNNLSVDYGAIIARGANPEDLAVIPGGPADKAGIVETDIILEINGTKIDEKNPLPNLIQKFDIGDEVKVKILHDGKEKTVTVKLEESK